MRNHIARLAAAASVAGAVVILPAVPAPADPAPAVVPTVSVSDASVVEPVTGNVKLVFTVSLSEATTRTVRVRFTTSDGTAVRPEDYNKRASTVAIPKGTTTREVNVIVKRDNLDEADETINVTLTDPRNGTLADDTGVGTIVDSD